MIEEEPHDKPAETPDEAGRSPPDGKQPDGTHLERRQKRNSELTEQAQNDPGGAHSGRTDPSNP